MSQDADGLVTVKQLRELLATAEDSDIVVMSKDAEGNDFSPIRRLENMIFQPTLLKSGNIRWYSGECHDRDDVENNKFGFNCLTIWPLN